MKARSFLYPKAESSPPSRPSTEPSQSDFSAAPQTYGVGRLRRDRLTVIAPRLEWFPRAAPKRRHVLFPGPVVDAFSAVARSAAGLTLQ